MGRQRKAKQFKRAPLARAVDTGGMHGTEACKFSALSQKGQCFIKGNPWEKECTLGLDRTILQALSAVTPLSKVLTAHSPTRFRSIK